MGTPAVPNDPTVQFVGPVAGRFTVDPTDLTIFSARVGHWDAAFETTASLVPAEMAKTLRNGEAEEENFVGSDSRRFYIRVTDPSAPANATAVKVKWRTRFGAPSNAPEGTKGAELLHPGSTEITCLRLPKTNPPVFASKGLMLVASSDDLEAPVNSGMSAKHADAGVRQSAGPRTKTQSDYRLRRASMFGTTEAEYTSHGGATVTSEMPVFDSLQKWVVKIRFLVMRKHRGDEPVVPMDEFFQRDLRTMIEVYAQYGVFFQHKLGTRPGGTKGVSASVLGTNYEALIIEPPPVVSNPAVWVSPSNISKKNRYIDIATAYPAPKGVVQVFYVDDFSDLDAKGIAHSRPFIEGELAAKSEPSPVDGAIGSVFVTAKRTPYTMAHEVGHVLTRKSGLSAHYSSPGAPFTDSQNLMKDNGTIFDGAPAYAHSRRLWDKADAHGHNQFQAMMTNSEFLKR